MLQITSFKIFVSFLEKLKRNIGIEEEEQEKKEELKEKPKIRKVKIKKTPEIKEKKIERAVVEEEKREIIKEKWFEPKGELAVDVYQTENDLVIQTAIAGIKPDNLDISIENDILNIEGKREKPEEDGEEKNYFYQECYWGPFQKRIILQEEVDNSRIEAVMNDGILTIRIPKIQKKKKIKVIIKS